MTKNGLINLMNDHETTKLGFEGTCHDCKCNVNVMVDAVSENDIKCDGGAIYQPDETQETFFLKCDSCFSKKPAITNFIETEVYCRTVGYYRPVKTYNPGMRAMFNDRRTFNLPESITKADQKLA